MRAIDDIPDKDLFEVFLKVTAEDINGYLVAFRKVYPMVVTLHEIFFQLLPYII